MSDYPEMVAGSAPISPLLAEFFRNGLRQNISGATTLEFIFERSDGTSVTRTGTFVTDGTDGAVGYRFVAEDTAPGGTPVTGLYKVRVRIAGTISAEPFDEITHYQYFHVSAP